MPRPASLLTARSVMALCGLSCLAWFAGCTVRPPFSSEELTVDSVTLRPEVAQGVTARPFCLHLRYANVFFVAYSDSRTEAWVTDGRCGTPPPAESGKADKPPERRKVESVRVSWWNDWYDTQRTRQCPDADACRMNDTNIVEGRHIRCASAQARDGDQTAFLTTDQAVCH